VIDAFKKPHFGIQWQAFLLTSMVLTGMFIFVLLVLMQANQKQFETAVQFIFDRNERQFHALLDVEGEKVSQLAQFTARNNEIANLLNTNSSIQKGEHLDQLIEHLTMKLEVEYGVDSVVLFDTQAKLLSLSGESAQEEFVERILETRSRMWRLHCDVFCSIEAGAPIFNHRGVLGVVVLREPLRNYMEEFYQVTKVDTALMAQGYKLFNYVEHIKPWETNLVDLTNPEITRPILLEAQSLISAEQLSKSGNIVEVADALFHIQTFKLDENQVLVAQDVTRVATLIDSTLSNILWMMISGIVVAEVLLILVLWRPMTKLRRTTEVLPYLSSRNYAVARKGLESVKSNRLVHDETEILRLTATKLCDELESMQKQLDTRAAELEKRSREFERERDFVNQLFDTMHAIILIQDSDGYIRQTNRYTEHVTGYNQDYLVGIHFAKLLDPSENLDSIILGIKKISKKDRGEYQHEAAVITHDQRLRFLAWRHVPLINKFTGNRQTLSIAVDISGRIEAETELAWLARHDSLSGLYNRHAFEEALHNCFAEQTSDGVNFGIVFLDLDDFKNVNDTYGHNKGDELIRQAAEALKFCSRDTDFVARMGGDEFALIIQNFHSFDLERICERIINQLSSIEIAPEVKCAASVGVAVCTPFTASPEMLLSNADSAMYQAKQAGKNCYVVFDGKVRITDDY